jgi:hypothetical protein
VSKFTKHLLLGVGSSSGTYLSGAKKPGLEQAPFAVFVYFLSSFQYAKNLLIMGPSNTKNSSKTVIFHI